MKIKRRKQNDDHSLPQPGHHVTGSVTSLKIISFGKSITLKHDFSANYVALMLTYGIARLFIAGLYFGAARAYPEKAGFAKNMGITFTLGAGISMGAVVFPFQFAIVIFYLGVGLFYFGKQAAYYVNRPEYRKSIILNTLVMFVIACLALFLPGPQYILFGAAFSKLVYIAMNFRAQRKLYGRVHL